MTTTPPNLTHYTLLCADVVLTTNLGPQSRRIQFISRSDEKIFPQRRLIQLQRQAATAAVTEIAEGSKGALNVISVDAIYIVSSLDCGWMTEEDFLREDLDVALNETAQEDNNASDTPLPDNVHPLR